MMNTEAVTDLRTRYARLLDERPRTRIRNAADELGVSELELVDLDLGTLTTSLRSDAAGLLEAITSVGEVMALTRNEAFVHERTGTYLNFSADHGVGLVVGPEIDLRIFLTHFVYARHVISPGPRGSSRRSVQFFDAHGEAVHKIFATEATDIEAFDQVIRRFAEPAPNGPATPSARKAPPVEKPDADVDADAFRTAWLQMTDTHEFFSITRRYGVSRHQALRLAPEGHARQLATSRFSDILKHASATRLPIMVFVNSRGCIQIHTGTVDRLVPTDGWFNVLDPRFNLHVRESLIDSAWHVVKPTNDGPVNSVEFFDRDGNLLCMLFGERKPGKPELEGWRELVAALH